jgi:hypothetical protein
MACTPGGLVEFWRYTQRFIIDLCAQRFDEPVLLFCRRQEE